MGSSAFASESHPWPFLTTVPAAPAMSALPGGCGIPDTGREVGVPPGAPVLLGGGLQHNGTEDCAPVLSLEVCVGGLGA